MTNKFLNKLPEISKIPIFLGLEQNQLVDILAYAKINNYKKNDFLFLEGEKKERFFIILKGLVKLTITDLEGKEAIIKIADFGNVGDILNGNFSYSCQVLEDCEILIFPLEKFKKIIKENEIIANNLLFDALKQNQDLTNQLAGLKLGNGKNKIGQFLLKNAIKDGKKTKDLNLSYNKSQIASYLGIRLETFSRLLHQLKDEGEISIQKSKIYLTEEKSLCKYCSSEIADKCQSDDASFCKY